MSPAPARIGDVLASSVAEADPARSHLSKLIAPRQPPPGGHASRRKDTGVRFVTRSAIRSCAFRGGRIDRRPADRRARACPVDIWTRAWGSMRTVSTSSLSTTAGATRYLSSRMNPRWSIGVPEPETNCRSSAGQHRELVVQRHAERPVCVDSHARRRAGTSPGRPGAGPGRRRAVETRIRPTRVVNASASQALEIFERDRSAALREQRRGAHFAFEIGHVGRAIAADRYSDRPYDPCRRNTSKFCVSR